MTRSELLEKLCSVDTSILNKKACNYLTNNGGTCIVGSLFTPEQRQEIRDAPPFPLGETGSMQRMNDCNVGSLAKNWAGFPEELREHVPLLKQIQEKYDSDTRQNVGDFMVWLEGVKKNG